MLTEALDFVDKTGERCYEAELYRIKGELLLAQARQQATGERATVRQQSSVEKKTKSKGRKLLFPDP